MSDTGRGAVVDGLKELARESLWVTCLVPVLWTFLLIGLFLWEHMSSEKRARVLAEVAARSSLDKDWSYRVWAAMQGGVYVPVTDYTQPNPYLVGVAEREITTPSGRLLTLVNPAYMTRQVHELEGRRYGAKGHVTSLKPLRPENGPDGWERRILEGWERDLRGARDVSSVEKVDGADVMRVMRPLVATKDCLKCHGVQGYVEGAIRGGLSASVPMAVYRAALGPQRNRMGVALAVIWVLGLAGFGLVLMQARRRRLMKLESERNARAARDCTDRQVQLDQRLNSLGVLAGGVAHDFNNLLGGVLTYVELARDRVADPDAVGYLDESLALIGNTRALTGQLLTFAKGGHPVCKEVALFPEVGRVVKQALAGTNVSCRLDVADGLWRCACDLSQISQVMTNLVINAQQAMPDGGTIEVSAWNSTVGADFDPGLVAGRYVCVRVSDFGEGIPAERLARIFDPFFTTRPQGRGLGLAVAYSVLRRHGGAIRVASEPGKGSVFTLYLPAVEPVVEPVVAVKPAVESGRAVLAGSDSGRTVLVMDDERYLREAAGLVLRMLGHRVLLAENGEEAIRRVKQAQADGVALSAAILDLTVAGGMGGVEAMAAIKELVPGLPGIAVSGYVSDPVIVRPTDHGFAASLAKPYSREQLVELLATVMVVR